MTLTRIEFLAYFDGATKREKELAIAVVFNKCTLALGFSHPIQETIKDNARVVMELNSPAFIELVERIDINWDLIGFQTMALMGMLYIASGATSSIEMLAKAFYELPIP